MSALSRSSLWQRITSKELVVSPILDKNQVGPSSIDLRMGTVALMSRAGSKSHVHPADYVTSITGHHAETVLKQQKHERFDIPFRSHFLLHPGSLILVPTFEWVKIPANLQGVVTARSSWAREGLSIATATIINPGYCGIVTLELANLGEVPIALFPGLKLAQMALYELETFDLDSDKENLDGQYNMSFEPSGGNIAKGDKPFLPASSS